MTKSIPIMSQDDERFMAFTGLEQWTQAVIFQSKRIISATEQLNKFDIKKYSPFTMPIYLIHCEHHYFVIAVQKLIEHREWIKKLGLCVDVDFSEIDSFSKQDIKDLRNMREHIVEYFQGEGYEKSRWFVETSEFRGDASSGAGTIIGGRLDYIKFSDAAERLLSQLIKEPIPYPRNEL